MQIASLCQKTLYNEVICHAAMKITAIQSDLSGGGALGFLKVKYSDSDDWQFITLSEDPDDGLWNWDDKNGDSDILSLEN